MKLLHVISSTNPKHGGPIEGITQLQSPLAALGVRTEVACSDPPDSPWLKTSRLKNIHALGPSYLGYGYAPRLVPWLRENAHGFDAVIAEGIWQYHSFAVWRALAGREIPYFVFAHGMLDPWFKRAYPLKHLKKWLYWPWAEYRVLRDARAVFFTTEEERLLARTSFSLYSAREKVTPYGTASPPVNTGQAEHFLSAFPRLSGKRLVLFLSRIQEKKGCDLLLEAFAQVAPSDERLHLVMAGPDQTGWAETLKIHAARLGIADSITWTGMLQGDRKWGAFHAAEVFCLPSHQENFGIVVAEALGCGKPVLISNKVNIGREIEADAAGFVEADTIEGTARNLRRWLALTPEDYTNMCERARRCFAARFPIRQAAEQLAMNIRQALPAPRVGDTMNLRPCVRVSIVVAAYNAEAYLHTAIDSALCQTERNLEVIIVDDCSVDGTEGIARAYEAKDARVRVLKSTANRGQYYAMNRAISVARGEWIAILDADDRFEPARLQIMLDAGEEANAAMVADNLLFYDAKANAISRTMLPETGKNHLIDLKAFLKRSNPVLYNKTDYGLIKPVFRTALHRDKQLRYYEVRNCGDYYFLLSYLMTGGSILFLSRPLYHYTEPLGSISRRFAQGVPKPYPFRNFQKLTLDFLRDNAPSLSARQQEQLRTRARMFGEMDRLNRFKEHLRDRNIKDLMKILLESPVIFPGVLFIRFYQYLKTRMTIRGLGINGRRR